MNSWHTHQWTVQQEIDLLEHEENLIIRIVTNVGIRRIKFHEHKPDWEIWVRLDFADYWNWKKAEKLSKIRNKVMYNELRFINISSKQEVISDILLNYAGIKNNSLYLYSSTLKRLGKQLMRSIIIAWYQSRRKFLLFLKRFQLTHKQLWRIIFAARHITHIRAHFCQLDNIREIETGVYLEKFNTTEVSLYSWNFVSQDDSIDNNESVIPIINTLSNMKQMGSDSKNPLLLKLIHKDLDMKSMKDKLSAETVNSIKLII